MPKKIILVGHCGPDSSYLRMSVARAVRDATIQLADDDADLARQISAGADLLLLNRQLDYGFAAETGVDLIKQLRAAHPNLRMMLVSNYPDAQAAAIAAGALPGFGKRELGAPRVGKVLREALGVVVDELPAARE
jgi:two-component system, chemotaxis family, chemotaxis protein CheY